MTRLKLGRRWTTALMALLLALASVATAQQQQGHQLGAVQAADHRRAAWDDLDRRLLTTPVVVVGIDKRQSNNTTPLPPESLTREPPPISDPTTSPPPVVSRTSITSSPPPVTPSTTSTSIVTPPTTSSSTTPSSTSSSLTSSTPSSTSTHESSSSTISSHPLGPSTVIITTTLENGSVMTSASMATQTADSSNSNSSLSSNQKAWIIPLSVVGGIMVLAGLLFMGYRCTQQRFSELDDDDGRGIRWPELLKPSEEETTTLNPLSTKRREGAAGFDMDETKSIASHEGVTAPMEGQRRGMREQYGVDGAWNSADHQEHLVAAGLGIPGPVMMSRTPSSAGSSTDHFSGGNGQYYASPHQQQAYYDPYLGVSGAPYPPPRSVSPQMPPPMAGIPYYESSAYGMQAYPPQQTGLHRSPSASPPMSQHGSMQTGMSIARSPSVPLDRANSYNTDAYPAHHRTYSNSSENLLSPGAGPRAVSPTSIDGNTQLRPERSGYQPTFRLSVANPDED